MAKPILYSFRRCPYAMRARLAIAASGIQVELREILLRDKPAAMVDASPKATVPVMILPNEPVLEESLDIMDWALAQADPHSFLAHGEFARDLVLRCETEFKPHLDRFKYQVRYDDVSPDYERAQASLYLQQLEQRLAMSTHLFGPDISFADIGIAPFVRQFANSDRIWFDAQPWPALHRWLENFINSDRFQRIMTKFPQWQPGDTPTSFPSKASNAP